MLAVAWWLPALATRIASVCEPRAFSFALNAIGLIGFSAVGSALLVLSRRDAGLSRAMWLAVPERLRMLVLAIVGSVCASALARTLIKARALGAVPTELDLSRFDVAALACWLLVAFLAGPVAEELTYRGFLLAGGLRTLRRPVALLLVSAAFVIGHRREDDLFALIVGASWYSWCFLAGRLLVAIVAHACWNVVAYALVWRNHLPGFVSWLDPTTGENRLVRIGLLLSGLAIALVGMVRLVRRSRAVPEQALSAKEACA